MNAGIDAANPNKITVKTFPPPVNKYPFISAQLLYICPVLKK